MNRRQHSPGSVRPPLREAIVLLAVCGVGAAAIGLSRVAARGVSGWLATPAATQSPGQLIGALCAAVAALLLTWVWLGALLSWLASRPGTVGSVAGAWSARVAPSLVRSAVAAALGGALAIGTLTTASAAPAPASATASATATATATASPAPPPGLPAPGWTPAPGSGLPTAAWTPSRPPSPPAMPAMPPADVGLVSTAPRAGHSVDEHVVVRPGDTLWAIAARHLGRDADAAEIAHEWPRWFAANRAAIGPDPDLLQPGELLRPPAGRR